MTLKDRTSRFSRQAVWSLGTYGWNSPIQAILPVPLQETSSTPSFHITRCPGPWIQLGLCYMTPSVLFILFPRKLYSDQFLCLYLSKPTSRIAIPWHYSYFQALLVFTDLLSVLLCHPPSPNSESKWGISSVPCHPLLLRDQDVQFFPTSPVKHKTKCVTKKKKKPYYMAKGIGSWLLKLIHFEGHLILIKSVLQAYISSGWYSSCILLISPCKGKIRICGCFFTLANHI